MTITGQNVRTWTGTSDPITNPTPWSLPASWLAALPIRDGTTVPTPRRGHDINDSVPGSGVARGLYVASVSGSTARLAPTRG